MIIVRYSVVGLDRRGRELKISEHGTSDSWECAKVSIHTRN